MSYCRLCLTDLMSLEDVSIHSIHEKIQTVFSFEITSHPDLPEVICPACAKTISQFYDYYGLVHQNQLKLNCQIKENIVKTKYSKGKKLQSVELKVAVEKEIQIEYHDEDFDIQNEPMEDDDSSQDITMENGDEWLPEDEIKIEQTKLISDDSYEIDGQSWKLESNCLFRQLDIVCDICQKVVFSYQRLEDHIQKVHAKQCWIACCKLRFTSEQISNHFQEHIPVVKLEGPLTGNHDDNEPHTSHYNSEIENNSWILEVDIICRNLDMICEICHVNQCTYQKLVAHLGECHSRQCYITCCGLKLGSDQTLVNHFENHCPNVTSKETFPKYEYTKINIFETILTDFADGLKEYEPLPVMELALKNDTTEKKKLDDVVDFLVQKYFPLNCQQCEEKCDNSAARRKHFSQSHPEERYYDSCCGFRFLDIASKMRHLNHHWKPIINVSKTKNTSPSDNEKISKMMDDFRNELEEAGFKPRPSWTNEVSANDLNCLRQMQDFLIAKYLPLNCELCDAQLSSYTERRDHLRNLHSLRRFYIECCNSKFYRRIYVMLHLWRHKKGLHLLDRKGYSQAMQAQEDATIEGFFKMNCTFCDFRGNSYLRLRSHVLDKHREEGFFITCCNIRLHKRVNILAHIASHQNPFVKCEHCEEKFPTVQGLKIHIRIMHSGEMIFKCDQCDEIFPDPKMLHDHQYKHNQSNCDICGLAMNKYSLQRHKKTVHKLGEEIKCPDCPKVFYYSTEYIAHRKKAHLKSKIESVKAPSAYNIRCPLCPNVYTSQKGLKIHHQRAHVGKDDTKNIP